jgi:hypothetical protein
LKAIAEVGGSNVVSILINVLLPAPFGPIRSKISPRFIVSRNLVDRHQIGKLSSEGVDLDNASLIHSAGTFIQH